MPLFLTRLQILRSGEGFMRETAVNLSVKKVANSNKKHKTKESTTGLEDLQGKMVKLHYNINDS